MFRLGSLLFTGLLLCHPALRGAEDKNRLIRTSEPLTAEQELQEFHLPKGFSIQLFADEALLQGKPINMAFDARGRLWVSCTREYPFAVPKDRWSDAQGTRAQGSRDAIRILEDTDGDGRADKATVFADELNIPTGVLPYRNGCIAWSIPNIWYLEDSDGDGKCDKRSILFGPLGWEKDTHGMISSLRLGLDGWVYATHGFSNTSHFEVRPENRKEVEGPPSGAAQTLDITSGSVFRFKPDGSRVELWTSGQVNPFGLCWDSWGNLYSADCHSNPISQLIRGACYPSFGKPHDGLGFAPVMCEHAHGSTGLCGIIYLDGGVWGPEWDDHMFVGNCVTSRVNHDHVTFHGLTPKANEAPDFLTSDDPWFRPVDLQLGPDSALYVADFYNRIIGHYEVPLDHAGRDRERGRIWRVVRTGYTKPLRACNLGRMDAQELVSELHSSNLTRRYLATDQLVSRIGSPALRITRELLSGKSEAPDAPVVGEYDKLMGKDEGVSIADTHALWVAYHLGDASIAYRVGRSLITGGPTLQGDAERLCAASINIIGEKGQFDYEDEETLCDAEFDARGLYSMRAAGLAMARNAAHVTSPGCLFSAYLNPPPGSLTDLQPFPDIDLSVPLCESGDATLIAIWKIAVRAVLSHPKHFQLLDMAVEDPPRRAEMAEVVSSVASPEAAIWLLNHVKQSSAAIPNLPATLSHIARYLPVDRTADLVTLAQKHFGSDLDTQLDLFIAVREGRSQSLESHPASSNRPNLKFNRTQPGEDAILSWSTDMTQNLLAALRSEPVSIWTPALPPTDASPDPWLSTSRKCADSKERAFLDSHAAPGSEKYIGTLRSPAFPLPSKLTFWLAGHRGFPTTKPHEMNFVRLIEVGTGMELARAYPPRHDVAQLVTWTFHDKAEEGQQVLLELTDGDAANAYAWLAVGGFEPAVVSIPADSQQRDRRIGMLATLAFNTEASSSRAALDYLAALPDKAGFTPATRAELAETLAHNIDNPTASLLAPLARDGDLASTLFSVLSAKSDMKNELHSAFHSLPFRSQVKLATALAGSADSAKMLLDLAAPFVLADPLVSTKINALNHADISQRLKTITASLPPRNEALNQLISARLKTYDPSKADAQRGEQVFTAVCSVCHRIGVRGNLIGPQLDGIGARGVERLLEDILDPNRAVDPAFRLHMVKRTDGTLYSGLLRREEGNVVVFADAAAQEIKIPKQEILNDEESPFSLMPPGLGEALGEQQLHDLLGYLLERK